jgi:hypothetical protein
LADARLTANVPLVNASNAFTVGNQSVTIATAAHYGLRIKGASSQSGNLQEWQDNSGTNLLTVSSSGKVTSNKINIRENDIIVNETIIIKNF